MDPSSKGGRLAIMPQRWFDHPGIGADGIAVLAVMALHADKNGICWPSQGLMARLLGRSRPWVNKVIAHLCEIGLLEKTHRHRSDGGDRSCLYRLPVEPISTQPQTCSKEDTTCPTDDTPCHTKNTGKAELEINQDSPAATKGAIENYSKNQPARQEATVPATHWCPSDAALLQAMQRFPDADIALHVEGFISKCRAKGYAFRDVEAGWWSWLLEDMSDTAKTMRAFRGRTPKHEKSRISLSQTRFDAWSRAAAAAPRAA